MSCNICGQPDFIRCNCEAAQPFCDQCAEDTNCTTKMDAQCVIYHFNRTTPSQLTCLGLANGVSVEEILEAIDDLICSNFNIPFEPVDTASIEWTPGGPAGHKPQADVILSPDAGQIIIQRANGLFAENDHKVKVDAADTPDYLENQIEGVLSPTGVSIEIENVGGVLQVKASIDLETFGPLICQFCNATSPSPSGGVSCDDIDVFGTFELGTPSNGLLQIPITVIGSGQISVTATVNNGSFNGAITQTISTGVTTINLPIFYNGSGSDGIQNIIIDFIGTSNTIQCSVGITVDPGVSCTPVSIIGTPSLPDAYVGIAYNYTISLNGTQPFALSSVIKPSWMTITVVGGDIIFSGTPTGGDTGTGISVSFTIENCVSDTANFSDTIDVTVPVDNFEVLNFGETDINSVTPLFYTISTGSFPIAPPDSLTGVHGGFSGIIIVNLSGAVLNYLRLFINGTPVQCMAAFTAGNHYFASTSFLATDDVKIRLSPTPC